MKIKVDLIKQLREKTSAGVADIRQALEKASGDLGEAEELLRERGFEKAAKKGDRTTNAGLIESYIHGNGKVGVLVELLCETDFVARTSEFKHLAHEICLQVASMNPTDNKSLLKQEYIRDASKTIVDLIKETIAILGENIKVGRFSRFELGK